LNAYKSGASLAIRIYFCSFISSCASCSTKGNSWASV